MEWDDPNNFFRNRECGPGINSPVTIVEGRGECGPGRAPTINLEEYSDYLLAKWSRQRQWDNQAGVGGNWDSMRFSVVGATADTPLKAIGSTILDGMYLLSYGLVGKVPAAGAGTITLTVTYYDVLSGSVMETLTQSLAVTGKPMSGPTPIIILGGSAVTVAVTNAGLYNGASYDAFVGLQRVG
jgi:hypothetical protein